MASNFTVIAIIAAYNEVDIIEQVVVDLIDQGINVYFMDDGSTDGTPAAVERYLGRGVIAIERLTDTLGAETKERFQWGRILERKASLANTLDATWFIHHDADEFRESPWLGDSLRDAIQRVDALGYNAIDSARFDFWPVDDSFRAGADVRLALPYYAEPAPYNKLQIRCWKKTSQLVDLASSGGHEVRFSGRNVFPVRFILRHYAIRGHQHGQRKLAERRARFLEEERARGWHVQYDGMPDATSFIHDPSTLARFDSAAIRFDLLVRQQVKEIERGRELDLSALQETVAARTREIEACVKERASLEKEFATHVAAAATEAEDLKAAVQDARNRLDELYRSLSWQCTAPVRAAYRVLRRMVRR